MAETVSKEREKQILKAARGIFARFGFSKTTMEDISAEVAMGKASLYYYFPTKESLFEAVTSQERDEFMQKIGFTLQKQNSAAEKLKTYVEERMKFFHELLNLGMLSYHSFAKTKPVHQKLSNEFALKEMKVIESIIEEGKTSGEFDQEINAEELSSTLIHLLQGLRLRAIKGASGMQSEEKSIYDELSREMILTINIFISAIKAREKESLGSGK